MLVLHLEDHEDVLEESGDASPRARVWALEEERKKIVEAIFVVPGSEELRSKST